MKKDLKVTYIGDELVCDEQVNFGNHIDPRGILKEGFEYEVENVEVHSWHVKVYLKEIEGSFNGIWFKDFEPDEEDYKNFYNRKFKSIVK